MFFRAVLFALALIYVFAEDSGSKELNCEGEDVLLPRTGCKIWCRRHLQMAHAKRTVAIDYVIGNRTDGLACVGVRPFDSASASTSEESSSRSQEYIVVHEQQVQILPPMTSGENSTSSGSASTDASSGSASAAASSGSASAGTSEGSSDASDISSDESYEYVMDPLFLGHCVEGICEPTYK